MLYIHSNLTDFPGIQKISRFPGFPTCFCFFEMHGDAESETDILPAEVFSTCDAKTCRRLQQAHCTMSQLCTRTASTVPGTADIFGLDMALKTFSQHNKLDRQCRSILSKRCCTTAQHATSRCSAAALHGDDNRVTCDWVFRSLSASAFTSRNNFNQQPCLVTLQHIRAAAAL